MKNGKRHLILAGLVLVLGTAVYLNWQFAPTESFIAPVRSNVSRSDLGRAEFVNAEIGANAGATGSGALAESRLNRRTPARKVKKKSGDNEIRYHHSTWRAWQDSNLRPTGS